MADNGEYEVIELIGEDGEGIAFHHLLTFEYNAKHYLALQQVEDEEDMVTIMRIDEEPDGGEVYEVIEDEKELDAAFNEFVAIMEQEEEEE